MTGQPIVEGFFASNLMIPQQQRFRAWGEASRIRTPVEISDPSVVQLGRYVSLGRYGKILALDDFTGGPAIIEQHYPGVVFDRNSPHFSRRHPAIVLKDGVSLGDNFFLAATCRIEIGTHTVISARCFLTDCAHVYEHPDLPIALQGNTEGTPLIIEEGCWLGINVSVIKGVRIGKHSVIGAHSVVTHDIPAYAVAAGVPAKVIRMQR